MPTELKRLIVYVTEEEEERIKAKAEERQETVSAYIRQRLGLKIELRRGAPEGNRNAAGVHKPARRNPQQGSRRASG